MKQVLFGTFFLLSFITNAQIQNGSFEDANGNATFTGWETLCSQLESDTSTATNTSQYCLKLEAGNTQSCMPGIAYQKIEGLEDGAIVTVSAYAKLDSVYFPAIASLTLMKSIPTFFQNLDVLAVDTTSSTQWIMLEVIDTIESVNADSVYVGLYAGITGGPALGFTYFDEVEVSIDLPSNVLENNVSQVKIYPNPAQEVLNFESNIIGSIKLFDVMGKCLYAQKDVSTIKIELTDFDKGMYFVAFNSDKNSFIQKVIIQ